MREGEIGKGVGGGGVPQPRGLDLGGGEGLVDGEDGEEKGSQKKKPECSASTNLRAGWNSFT